MTPQQKYKSQGCYELTLDVFDKLFSSLPAYDRFVDRDLYLAGYENFLLIL